MKVGIFGGSFNPVHNEHIEIAKKAVSELGLDRLYIVPTYVAPHKIGAEVLSGEDRLNMLSLAFKGESKITPCDYELKQGGVSYSYLTVNHFKNLHKGAEIFFLVGSDMLENFPTWKNPENILENAKLVLIERRNGDFETDKLTSEFRARFNKDIVKLQVFGTTVSSTEIRFRLMLGLSVEGMLNPLVYDYIVSNSLYLNNKYFNYVKNALPEKRRTHTLGVIMLARSLAKKLGVSVENAELSALLHDVAKYKNKDDFPNGVVPEDAPSDVWHQYLSYYVAKNELGVTNEDVLNAILYHTTGRANMSDLERLIYIADLLEPSRKFLGVDELRKAIDIDFDKGFLTCLIEIEDFLIKQGKEVFPLTKEAINYYKGEHYELN